jgi:hypothetical protein
MPFRAAREKGTGGRGRQQRRVSIPGIGAATAFARLIEMPEPVLGPHGTIEGASLGFSLLQCASTCGYSTANHRMKLARPTKDPWQMLLIPEFKLG